MKQSSFFSLWAVLVLAWGLGMATTSFFASKPIFDRIFWVGLALVPLAQAAVLQSVGRILQKKGEPAPPVAPVAEGSATSVDRT